MGHLVPLHANLEAPRQSALLAVGPVDLVHQAVVLSSDTEGVRLLLLHTPAEEGPAGVAGQGAVVNDLRGRGSTHSADHGERSGGVLGTHLGGLLTTD